MGKPRFADVPRPDTTQEQARDLRARAWAYVFSCYEAKKKPGGKHAGKETKGPEHDRPAPRI